MVPAPVGAYTQPVFYGPSSAAESAEPAFGRHGQRSASIDLGVASWQSGQSVTYAMAGSSGARKAARSYSNQDVDKVNETNGTVKYRGKTEHI
jgi:hypothetical protein